MIARVKKASPRMAARPASRWPSSPWKTWKADRRDDLLRDVGRPHQRVPDALAEEQIIFLKGKVDKRRETPGILVSDIVAVQDSISKLTRGIKVEIEDPAKLNDLITQLKPILTKHKGNCDTFIQVPIEGQKKAMIRLDRQWFVKPSTALKEDSKGPKRPRQGRTRL